MSIRRENLLAAIMALITALAAGQANLGAQIAAGPNTAVVPSLPSTPGPSGLQSRPSGAPPNLPTDAGQYWQTYDLRPYTKELTSVDRPQQAIVDWVLRETGTDVWFTDPFGFLNADRETLRVYHNDEMHQIVRDVHERFVNGTTDPQRFGLRLMTVNSPNWRTRAGGLMRSVKAQSPGVRAYLLSKENSAIFMALLRGRSDFRELSSNDLIVMNGQPQVLEQLRGRNFIEDYQPAQGAWPPYMPTTGEIKEGYRLQLSPLLSVDEQIVDLVIKCNIDQVERLVDVNLDLPLQGSQVFPAQINVPQVASWRLHERFRWPAGQVLLLSCGVVAAPQEAPNDTLMGRGGSLFGLDRVLPTRGDRADALLLIEYRGDAKTQLSPTVQTAQQAANPLSRGRY